MSSPIVPTRRDLSARQAGPALETDIEITPEMLIAGVEAFCLSSSEDRASWVVPAVFRAMAALSPQIRAGKPT